MANEAVIIELGGSSKGNPTRFTCANGTGIKKGTILYLEDPRTVSGVYVHGQSTFAGIAAEEKVASDGQTSIGCWTCGIFDCLAGEAINLGDLVRPSGANAVRRADSTAILSGQVMGKCLETAANGEVVAIAVGMY